MANANDGNCVVSKGSGQPANLWTALTTAGRMLEARLRFVLPGCMGILSTKVAIPAGGGSGSAI